MLASIVAGAAVLWAAALPAAAYLATLSGGPAQLLALAVYGLGSVICHQRPERSFHTADVKWPVCGRCSGLYLGAPVGALTAWSLMRGRRRRARLIDQRLVVLAIAAVPTIITIGVEWFRLLPVNTLARFLAALPLGAAIAFVILSVVPGPSRPIEYTGRA